MEANFDLWSGASNTTSWYANLLNAFNCDSTTICAWMSVVILNIIYHYYPGDSKLAVLTPHPHNPNYNSVGYMDVGFDFMLYNGYYIPATIDQIVADSKLVNEPIRSPIYTTVYNSWANIASYYQNSEWEGIRGNTLALTMKIPSGGNFIFPIKSSNAPNIYGGGAMANYASGIATFAVGVTGTVTMPFVLTQVTGTGTITINGITYTLPTDNATVKALLQIYADSYYTFQILTNTGGISAEYLINPRRMLLWSKNNVFLNSISGSAKWEYTPTAIPIDTINLNITKNTYDLWTINYDQYLSFDGNVKYPKPYQYYGSYYTVVFKNTLNGRPQQISFNNSIKDSTTVITAGATVIDQCFASRLDPKDDVFTSSLQLAFTSYDGSDCYYTLDGTVPDGTKTKYTAPFTITQATTVRWINIKSGYANSHINIRSISLAPIMPTGMTLSLISGGVGVSWTDTNGRTAQTEVWGGNSSGSETLLYTIDASLVSKNDICSPVDLRYYKIRALSNGQYSAFTSEQSIAMLGAEMMPSVATWATTGTGWWTKWNTGTGNGTKLTFGAGSTLGAGRTAFWSIGSTYRVIVTAVIRSGSMLAPYIGDSTASGNLINGTKTYNYYVGAVGDMQMYGTSTDIDVTYLSIKHVLNP